MLFLRRAHSPFIKNILKNKTKQQQRYEHRIRKNKQIKSTVHDGMIGLELQRYNIDIAALSETRFADTGSITEVGAGYTFFWSGKAADERREAGVGFAIRTPLVRHLESLPKGINDRLMMLRLPLKGKTNLTLISASVYIILYIVFAYLMLFAALTNAVCLYNASFFAIDFCKCFLFSCFDFVYIIFFYLHHAQCF